MKLIGFNYDDHLIKWFETEHRLKIRQIPYTSGKDKWVVWGWNKDRVLWENLSGPGYEERDAAIEHCCKIIQPENIEKWIKNKKPV